MSQFTFLRQMGSGTFGVLIASLMLFSGCNQQSDASNRLNGGTHLEVDMPDLSDSVEGLTTRLVQEEQVSGSTQANVSKLENYAKARRDSLLGTIESNPGRVLKVMLPDHIRKALSSSAQKFVEREVEQLEGVIEHTSAIFENGFELVQHTLIQKDGTRLALYFSNQIDPMPPTGSFVRIVHGFQIPTGTESDAIIVDSSLNSNAFIVDERDTPELPEFVDSDGPHSTVVILVNFQDQPTSQPWSLAQIKDLFFNLTHNYYKESSYGKTTLVGDVYGWYTIPFSSTGSCDSNTIATLARNAATNAGVNVTSYKHRVYMFPKLASCSWGGLGTIGGNGGTTNAWLNGYWDLAVGHELGHNFGLWHANGWDCGNAASIGTNCSVKAYQDPSDIMGNKAMGHFNALHKEQLGWLNTPGSPTMTTVETSGTFLIEPYETVTTNMKALKVLKANLSNGSKDYYYLEYRQNIGFDARIPVNLRTGVMLHTGNSSNRDSSLIIDMVPSTQGNYSDASILTGQSFTDPGAPNGGVTIKVNSVSPVGASVTVSFGSQPSPCVRANPTLSISPGTTPWISPGATASYTLTMKNNDSLTCGSSSFDLSMPQTSGIGHTFGGRLNAAPGATVSTSMVLKAPSTIAAGVYTLPVTVVNAAATTYKASANASLGILQSCVRSHPSMTITPGAQSIQPGQKVTYTLSLTNRDGSGCATSKFNLNAPAFGSTPVPTGLSAALNLTSLSLAPGATGTASVEVSSTTSTGLGTYALSVTGYNAGATQYSGKASVSLGIQSPLVVTVKGPVQKTIVRSATTQRLSWLVNVQYNGAPAVNAPVKATMYYPDGTTSSATGYTRPNGEKGFLEDIFLNSLAGTYRLELVVTFQGITRVFTDTIIVQ